MENGVNRGVHLSRGSFLKSTLSSFRGPWKIDFERILDCEIVKSGDSPATTNQQDGEPPEDVKIHVLAALFRWVLGVCRAESRARRAGSRPRPGRPSAPQNVAVCKRSGWILYFPKRAFRVNSRSNLPPAPSPRVVARFRSFLGRNWRPN